MKFIDLLLIIVANIFFVINQITAKLWLINKDVKVWPINLILFRKMFSWEVLLAIVSFLIGGFIWAGLLKRIDLSIIYPLISISYIFSVIAGYFVFKESISIVHCGGISLIIVGVILICK